MSSAGGDAERRAGCHCYVYDAARKIHEVFKSALKRYVNHILKHRPEALCFPSFQFFDFVPISYEPQYVAFRKSKVGVGIYEFVAAVHGHDDGVVAVAQ